MNLFENGLILGILSYYLAIIVVLGIGFVSKSKGCIGFNALIIVVWCISVTTECWDSEYYPGVVVGASPILLLAILFIWAMVITAKENKILEQLDQIAEKYISDNGYMPLDKFKDYIASSEEYRKERKIVNDLADQALPNYEKKLGDHETEHFYEKVDAYIEENGCTNVDDFREYCATSPDFEAARSLGSDGLGIKIIDRAVLYYNNKVEKIRCGLINDLDIIVNTYIEENKYQPVWRFEKYCNVSPGLKRYKKNLHDFIDLIIPKYERELRAYEIGRLPIVVEAYIDQHGYRSLHKFEAYCKTAPELEAANSISYELDDEMVSYDEYAGINYLNSMESCYLHDLEKYFSQENLKNFTLESLYKNMTEYRDLFRDENEELDKKMLEMFAEPLLGKMIRQGILKIAVGSGFDALYEFTNPLADIMEQSINNGNDIEIVRQGNMTEIIQYVDDEDDDD